MRIATDYPRRAMALVVHTSVICTLQKSLNQAIAQGYQLFSVHWRLSLKEMDELRTGSEDETRSGGGAVTSPDSN
jgi:hypothetical protein